MKKIEEVLFAAWGKMGLVKTLPVMLKAVGETAGTPPREAVTDRGFDQPLKSQKKLKRKRKIFGFQRAERRKTIEKSVFQDGLLLS